jgi:integrase
MKRKPLARYGRHGKVVSVTVSGDQVLVRWLEHGKRRKKTWPDTRNNRTEAKAWAERFAQMRTSRVVTPLRTDELWARYMEAEWPLVRPKTRTIYTDYWRKWQAFVGRESIAEDLGPETMASFRTALDAAGLAVNTVHRCLQTVKTVYSWGRTHRHLQRNEVRDYRYKIPKDRRPVRIPEYRADELAAILAQLPIDKATTWRAAGVLALCGLQGARVTAVLKLDWSDIDMEAGTIRWRPEWDKQGRDETSPMRAPTRAVLEAIRHRTNGTGWVFPAGSKLNKRATYSIQSLLIALHAAEQRAGLATVKYRGSHSLRRLVFNDVLQVSGDIGAAMAAIRDTSLQVASKYLRGRDDRVRLAFDALDKPA